MYKPLTLPALPRKTCPYEVIYTGRDGGVKARPCNAPALANGWCTAHGYVQGVLELADYLGCPAMVITSVTDQKTRQDAPALTVGRGLANWEGYALRHPISRHKMLIGKLKAAKAELDAENKKALNAAIEKARRRAAELAELVA